MPLYGNKSKVIALAHIDEECSYCGKHDVVTLFLYQTYFRIYWIPFIPLAKTGVSQCSHCKQLLYPKEMPPFLESTYRRMKSENRPPLWMFSGLFLLIVLIATLLLYKQKQAHRNAEYITAPQSGDILTVKLQERQYTLYKVSEIKGDSVWMQASEYEARKPHKLVGFENKEYSKDFFAVTKKELKKMFDDNSISNVKRKKVY